MKTKISITRHAKNRMRWRGITFKNIKSVLEKPAKTDRGEFGRINLYGIINKKWLKVVCRKEQDKIIIISALWGGKI